MSRAKEFSANVDSIREFVRGFRVLVRLDAETRDDVEVLIDALDGDLDDHERESIYATLAQTFYATKETTT